MFGSISEPLGESLAGGGGSGFAWLLGQLLINAYPDKSSPGTALVRLSVQRQHRIDVRKTTTDDSTPTRVDRDRT